MVKLISRPEYTIDNLPGFEHLVFSESSNEHLALPASVAFAQERGAVLQSAREAWAFRIDSNGTLDSDRYQSTRTAVLGVKTGNQYYVAFCDSPTTEENILLAGAQEGYKVHASGKPWLVRKDYPLVHRMLERAQDEHRVMPALESTLKLSTNDSGGASPYGTNPLTQAVLGKDLTETVAFYLSEHGFRNGYVWTLSPKTLRDIGVDDNHVDIRRVGVGGVGMNDLVAGDLCDGNGRARGVRENSTGNKG